MVGKPDADGSLVNFHVLVYYRAVRLLLTQGIFCERLASEIRISLMVAS